MPLELLTRQDLLEFKKELLDELQKLFPGDGRNTSTLLKSREVCTLLRISPGTLQNLRKNETLCYIRIGGILYYDREDIEKLKGKRRG